MYLYKGITCGQCLNWLWYQCGASSIALFMGSGTILGIITQLWGILYSLLFFILRFQNHLRADALCHWSEQNAARFSGINTVRIKFLSYVMGGVVFSIAGLVLSGRFSTIQFDSADPYLMQVIIACVLGGANMSGGRGTIPGTILGVTIIGILKGGMNVVLLPQTQQKIILGFVLLISLITFEIIAWRETRVKGKARLAAHNAS